MEQEFGKLDKEITLSGKALGKIAHGQNSGGGMGGGMFRTDSFEDEMFEFAVDDD
jgi:hypothetical protein